MMDVIMELPQWFIMVGIIYVAVMLSIAVFRGQEVQFFPPKMGPRPDKGDQKIRNARIEGVWGDSFKDHRDRGKPKAAIICIKFDEGNFKIDGYEYDESQNDIDDDTSFIDYSSYINGKVIKSATVTCNELPLITLSLFFL